MDREQTTIRLPAELKEQIQREAEKVNKSFNNLVEILLNKWVKNYQAQ